MSLLALLLLPACGSGASPEAEVPADEAPRPIVLTEVRLTTMSVARPFSHDAELRGLVTAAIELGLSDLPGVVPVVPGDAAALSFLGERPPPHRQVDARLSARGAPEALEFELELCVAGGGCLSTTSTGTAKDPWAAVGDMLDGAASVLDVEVSDEARAAWRKPGSKDNYSELITGRAAAQFYGILPPSLTPGDPRNDPVRKAVFLDPGQPLAQWIRARWEAATTVDGGKAADALGRAQLLRPTSPLLAADQATLLGLTGHRAEALLSWETLAGATPGDPRWLVPLARARLAADRADEAVAALEAIPVEFAWDPAVAELRVAAAEAAGGAADLDPLLARWQAVDTQNPEPVRRRIDARVRATQYVEAQSLIGALRDRDPGPQTDALEVALLVSLGRLDDAAALAPAPLAARIRARARLAAAPGEVPEALAADDPLRARVEAEVALWGKAPDEALVAAEAAVSARPNDAEAHALRARALEALGRTDDAAAAWTRAWELDPGLEGGPVEGGRIASTFQYVEQGEAPGGIDPTAGPGPKGPEL